MVTETLIHFDDSTNAAALPLGQLWGMFYMDGDTANEAAVRTRLPHAILFSLTVFGSLEADGCDCELGDMTIAKTISWVDQKIGRGDTLIIVYANAETWSDGLFAALQHYGDRIKRWVASYPGAGPTVPPGFDAHQYAGDVPGENGGLVDQDVALSTFLTPWSAPKPVPTHDSGMAVAQVMVNLETGQWLIRGLGSARKVIFAGKQETWHANISLQVGEGGGHWDAEGTPATPR